MQTNDLPPTALVAPESLLSKNAQKKAARKERYEATKLERRTKEKQAKKAKKAQLAQKRAAGELDSAEEAELEERKRSKRPRTATNDPSNTFNARVVVDLGFDEKMTEKEVASLTSQLAYVYAAHRRAVRPFHSLLFTGLNGRTHTRLQAMNNGGYSRWHACEWWQEGYEKLWSGTSTSTSHNDHNTKTSNNNIVINSQQAKSSSKPNTDKSTSNEQTEAPSSIVIESSSPLGPSCASKSTIVYLTADSSEELTELHEGETYIIGGIVDRNRYKNLCLEKAQKSGVRTARLPIGTYLASLPTRKVLTVNQVYEILLKWTETRDWELALYSVMPKRKFDKKDSRSTHSLSTTIEPIVVDAGILAEDAQDSDADKEATDESVHHAALFEGDEGILEVLVRDEDKNELEDAGDTVDQPSEHDQTDPAMAKPGVEVIQSSGVIQDRQEY